MGSVYKAIQHQIDRPVAVKTGLGAGSQTIFHQRLRVEAAAMGRVNHPNVAQIFAFEVWDGVPYLIMEYLPGGSLSDHIRSSGRLSSREAAQTLEPVVRGLAACHQAGVIHRDIKPANILFDAQRTPKLIDFGLAKLVGETEGDVPAENRGSTFPAGFTETGSVMGTPGYLAPEQARCQARTAGPAADIWSVGVVLYEMLTGQRPFSGQDLAGVLLQTLEGEIRPLRSVNHEVPQELEALCLRCLQRNPANRSSASAVADDLRAFLDERPESVARRFFWLASQASRLFGRGTPQETAPLQPASPIAPASGERGAAGIPPKPPDHVFPVDSADRPPPDPRRPSCLGVLNPVVWFGPRADPVDCSVFAPRSVSVGGTFLVQVFAHLPDRRGEAEQQARAADDKAEFRFLTSLGIDIPRETVLSIHLVLPGFEIPDPWQQVVWQGRTTARQFLVTAPSDLAAGTRYGTARVCLGGIPYGHLKFKLEVVPATDIVPAGPEAVGFDARRYQQAFVSYASSDRNEVLKRVQMLKRLKVRVFQDVLDLEPGVRWERELYRHIDTSDLFLLFWSSAARKSEWVRKELQYAVARKAGVDHAPPEIIPVVIEGPPPPPPPTGFQDRHFNDPLLYFIVPGGR
jgi:serine/threonine protein kinase